MTPRKAPRGYAIDTEVPAAHTRAEIETLCLKHGATSYAKPPPREAAG